jgi:hypothetical protein
MRLLKSEIVVVHSENVLFIWSTYIRSLNFTVRMACFQYTECLRPHGSEILDIILGTVVEVEKF